MQNKYLHTCHKTLVFVVIKATEPLAYVHLLLQMTKRLQKTLESTRFAGCPIVAVAARPAGSQVCRYYQCIITIYNVRKGKEEYVYSAFIHRLVSRRSDMDHTVLPANYNMPAFLS